MVSMKKPSNLFILALCALLAMASCGAFVYAEKSTPARSSGPASPLLTEQMMMAGAGSIGTGLVKVGEATTRSSLSSGAGEVYSFSLSSGAFQQVIELSGPSNADFDLYVKKGSKPSISSSDYSSTGSSSSERVTLNQPSSGTWYVLVISRSGSGSYSLSGYSLVKTDTSFSKSGSTGGSVTQTPRPTATIPIWQVVTTAPPYSLTGTSDGYTWSAPTTLGTGTLFLGEDDTWKMELSSSPRRIQTKISLNAPSGFVLYVKKGSIPDLSSYDYRSTSGLVTLDYPVGTYYIKVAAESGSGTYTLSGASLV
jgi:hypothetical protein